MKHWSGRIRYMHQEVSRLALKSPCDQLISCLDVTPPNFISDIFYLTSAMNHYGLNRALQSYEDLHKATDDVQRQLDFLTSTVATLAPGVGPRRKTESNYELTLQIGPTANPFTSRDNPDKGLSL